MTHSVDRSSERRTLIVNGVPSLQRAPSQRAGSRTAGFTLSQPSLLASAQLETSQPRQSFRHVAFPLSHEAARSEQAAVPPSHASPGSTSPSPHGEPLVSDSDPELVSESESVSAPPSPEPPPPQAGRRRSIAITLRTATESQARRRTARGANGHSSLPRGL